MELGGPSHEACAGIVALTGYLRTLAQLAPSKCSETHGADQDAAAANGHAGRWAFSCSPVLYADVSCQYCMCWA